MDAGTSLTRSVHRRQAAGDACGTPWQPQRIMTSQARRLFTAERGLRFGLWLLLLSVVATTRTDPDLWGHVRFGQPPTPSPAIARG